MAKLTDAAPSGMLDNIDITILKARTGNDVPYPTGDKVADCALILDVSTEDGQVHQQILSAGRSVHATPDGFMFDSTPKDSSKAKIFIMSLVKLNYPGIDEDVRVFEGAKIHVKTIKYESNLKRDEGQNEPTALVATAIVSLPGKGKVQAKRPTAVPAKPAATTTPPGSVAASNGDVDDQAREQVIAALAASPDGITRQRLGTVVMTAIANAEFRKKKPDVFANLAAIRKLVLDAAWLAKHGEATGKWLVSGEDVIAIPSEPVE